MSEPIEDAVARVLASRPEIAAGWVFGSYARGEARVDSDVDVAVLFVDPRATAATEHRLLGSIALDLEHVLRGRRIDLAVLDDRSSPIFAHRVLAEGKLVHEADRERRIAFEWRAHVRYLDFKPTWDIAARESARGFREWLESRR